MSPEQPGLSVPIIEVMVGLGRRLGLEVVAQGLEARLTSSRSGRPDAGWAGPPLARPQPAERTEAYLDGFPARQGIRCALRRGGRMRFDVSRCWTRSNVI